MSNFNQDPNPAPNPDFILDQLRDAFASSYDQKPFDDKQVSSFTQVGSDAQALHLWKLQIPEQQLSLVCLYIGRTGTRAPKDSLDKAEKDACSIECLTDLLRESLKQLPENKTVVVIIEGVDIFDTSELQPFKAATLKTMRFSLRDVMADTSIKAKVKVIVASSPALSWHDMFTKEETVQLVGSPSGEQTLGDAEGDI